MGTLEDLKEIRKSEIEASIIVKEAEEKAKKIIELARTKSDETIENEEIGSKKEKETYIKHQVKLFENEKSKGVSESQKEIEKIKSHSSRNVDRAVKRILELVMEAV